MKLTRLRLIGFKSFVEPTDFLIEPGLTGVVGPNGCGKSNLVEALRWVMGETSHKSMRAAVDGRRDLLRHQQPPGAQHRRSRRSRSTMPSARRRPQFNEQDTLDISRRIEREAGSAYRINGREVRARDVQILFADASTGARSPALVHQGRIGEIIQAKPEQRRRVLEEAAGISGLHARRHEAELRLKAAETNLLRVEDVIGQLAAQIDALKRRRGRRSAIAPSRRRCARPRRRSSICAGSPRTPRSTEAERAKDLSVRDVADAHRRAGRSRQAPGAGRRRAAAAARSRGARRRRAAAADRRPRDARPRGSARQGAHRRTRPAARAVRRGRRARAARWSPTPKQRWRGSPPRKRRIRKPKRAKAPAAAAASMPAWPTADGVLAAAEKIFGELTGALADLTAQRNQLENAAREQAERVARIDGEIADIEAELGHAAARAAGSSPRSPPRSKARRRR